MPVIYSSQKRISAKFHLKNMYFSQNYEETNSVPFAIKDIHIKEQKKKFNE